MKVQENQLSGLQFSIGGVMKGCDRKRKNPALKSTTYGFLTKKIEGILWVQSLKPGCGRKKFERECQRQTVCKDQRNTYKENDSFETN